MGKHFVLAQRPYISPRAEMGKGMVKRLILFIYIICFIIYFGIIDTTLQARPLPVIKITLLFFFLGMIPLTFRHRASSI